MKVENLGAGTYLNSISNGKIDKNESDFKNILDKAVSSKEDKDLKAAAKQFEAMFIYQMFQQMRKTVDKGGLLKESIGEDIFQDMLDYEVSTRASENSTLGLADIIYKQLKNNSKTE